MGGQLKKPTELAEAELVRMNKWLTRMNEKTKAGGNHERRVSETIKELRRAGVRGAKSTTIT